MATTQDVMQTAAPIEAPLTFKGRAFRFFARVVAGLGVAYMVTSLIALQGRLITEERRLDFPLWVALDDLGVAVFETRISAWATVESGEPPPMSRLKELARKAAGARSDEASFWSDAGEGYRAVYYEGSDPDGGAWLVSGNFIERVDGNGGRVDLAVGRSTYGKIPDVRNALYGLKRQMERAAAKPLAPAYQVRAAGRPPSGVSAEEFARELLRKLGVGAATLTHGQGEVVAFGYSPRLFGRADWEGTEVNVVVRVTERGLGPWVEVGAPSL